MILSGTVLALQATAVSKQSIAADPRMEKVTAAVVASGAEYSAADVYGAFAQMSVLSARARVEMSKASIRHLHCRTKLGLVVKSPALRLKSSYWQPCGHTCMHDEKCLPLTSQVDMLLVPTALQNFLIEEVEAEEKTSSPPTWEKNTLSGRFTNFVNLLDMAAISVPSAILQQPDLSTEAANTGEIPSASSLLLPSKNHSTYLQQGVSWGVILHTFILLA